MNILVIGQSHVAAVRDAARARRERHPERPRTRVIHTLEPRYGGEFADAARTSYSAGLIAAIEDQITRHRPRVASVIGGNAHNALALMRHPRPFDFLLPDGSGPPPDAGSELIPFGQMRAALETRLETDLARLRACEAAAGSFLHLESPPPLRDGDYITAHAEPWFRDAAGATVVAAGIGVRWRAWRLASQILREAVEELGCRYLPVPPEAQDPDGFLQPWLAADPTHGNEAYGEILIRAIEDS